MKPSELLNRADRKILKQKILENVKLDGNGCWIWQREIATTGYGRVYFEGIKHNAHRAAYVAWNGPINPRLEACHKCDVRACANPDHIFVGSRSDNMIDASKKKRVAFYTHPETMPHGEKHWKAKLSLEDVSIIRKRKKDGCKATDVAKEFAIHDTHVRRIWRQEHWKMSNLAIQKQARQRLKEYDNGN